MKTILKLKFHLTINSLTGAVLLRYLISPNYFLSLQLVKIDNTKQT